MKCVWNINFLTRQAIAKLTFVLHSTYARDTPFRVLLDLDNSLIRSKRPIYELRYTWNSQISEWKTNFFHRRAIAKVVFFLHSNYTGNTPYQIWLNSDNSLNRWKRPIFKILQSHIFRNNRKFPYEYATFFPGQARPKVLFCITLSLHWWYSIPSLVQFEQLLAQWKELFLKLPIRETQKVPYEMRVKY